METTTGANNAIFILAIYASEFFIVVKIRPLRDNMVRLYKATRNSLNSEPYTLHPKTLGWLVTNASEFFIDVKIRPLRDNMVSISLALNKVYEP